jgi:N-methylhydantoinase A
VTYHLGIDTGGTFTDVICYDETSQEVYTQKTPSTPPNFDQGVLTGIDEVLRDMEIRPEDVNSISHGTTVGTNAILEGELPRLGLITNEGLRDVIEIGDQTRPELYNLQCDKPPSLIPRRHRLGVPGRLDYAGEEIEPLDDAKVREAVNELVDAGVESIVVSTLFAHIDGLHEQRVGELIEEEIPGQSYALSSDVYPEAREYDRTVTTVLNEAVKNKIADYLERLRSGVTERDITAPIFIMHSGGGIYSVESAKKFALRTVLSGPAAGAVAVRDIAVNTGYDNAIGLDMGGTSADVSIVEDGEIIRSTEGEIADLPINTPLIDINTVGAGGGSLAWIDKGGGLRVGPESAGANPGPIIYDRGGNRPTVTDAQVLLGRIDPHAFGGKGSSAYERVISAFDDSIGGPLGVSREEAAHSVLQIANAKMAREIRRVTVERGRDPNSFALVAFGGAGPLHASEVAMHMNMGTVIIPRSAGVLSARGLLLADVRMAESSAYLGDEVDITILAEQFDVLESTLRDRFREGRFPTEEVIIELALDIRYLGQSYEIQVPVEKSEIDCSGFDAAINRFHDKHARLYGHSMPDEDIEIVAVRATGKILASPMEHQTGTKIQKKIDEREIYFPECGVQSTPIMNRSALEPGDTIEGPVVIEAEGSTALCPPGAKGRIMESGAMVLKR